MWFLLLPQGVLFLFHMSQSIDSNAFMGHATLLANWWDFSLLLFYSFSTYWVLTPCLAVGRCWAIRPIWGRRQMGLNWATGVCPQWADTPRWRLYNNERGAEPCPDKRSGRSPWPFLRSRPFSRSRRPSCLHMLKGSSEVKREGAPPHSKWCQPTYRPLH